MGKTSHDKLKKWWNYTVDIKFLNHRKKPGEKKRGEKNSKKILTKTRKKTFNIVKEQYFHQIGKSNPYFDYIMSI
jgi:hypothetical protein